MKYHPHGAVLFVTFSIEQGILLLSNPLCEAIIKSCLAAAQELYPVKISAFIVEGTHLHLKIVVQNPDDVPAFMRHFKTESAHAFNRLLGRRKRTIWCEGYDSPIVLTPVRSLLALAYLYANPAKDNLEDSIDSYPGLSSWKMFITGKCKKKWKRLRRPAFTPLPRGAHNLSGYTREAEKLLNDSNKTHQFVLEPNAWLEAFGITDPEEQKRYNEKLIDRVRTLEERARLKRKNEGRSVMGASRLRRQPFDTTRLSQRSGKRMWCLCEDRAFRISFINFLKGLFDRAREIRRRWAVGDYSIPYPLGLYPPSQPKLAEPISIW